MNLQKTQFYILAFSMPAQKDKGQVFQLRMLLTGLNLIGWGGNRESNLRFFGKNTTSSCSLDLQWLFSRVICRAQTHTAAQLNRHLAARRKYLIRLDSVRFFLTFFP